MAGLKGIHNPIAWVNLMEILDTPDSVQQNELLITTGYQLDEEEKHRDLIKRLADRNVSGLAIQPGYYIDKIPQYILEEAEKHAFPILELPPHLTFSAIIHTLMEEIGVSTSVATDNEVQNLFMTLLEGAIVNKQADNACDEKKYLFFVQPVFYSEAIKGAIQKGISQIKSYLLSQARERDFYFHTADEGNAVFYLVLKEDTTYQDVVFELTVHLTLISERQHMNYYVGVNSRQANGALEEAFGQCMDCIQLLERIEAKRGVCPYDNIPFFELFDRIQRNNRSILLGSQALQKLFEYDRMNDSQYVYTLRVYLSHEGNASRAAARLFIHRHTLLNRMQKITSICGLNMNDYYTRIYLSLALLVHDFFAL